MYHGPEDQVPKVCPIELSRCRDCGVTKRLGNYDLWLTSTFFRSPDEAFTKMVKALARDAYGSVQPDAALILLPTSRGATMVDYLRAEGMSPDDIYVAPRPIARKVRYVSCLDFDQVKDPFRYAATLDHILDQGGIAHFGFRYLPEVLMTSQLDVLDHETTYWWTLTALQRLLLMHHMEVLDAERYPIVDQGTGYMVVTVGRVGDYPHARGLYPWGWWEEGVGYAAGAVWDVTDPYGACPYRFHTIRNEVWRLMRNEAPKWATVGGSTNALRLGQMLIGADNDQIVYHFDLGCADGNFITPWRRGVFNKIKPPLKGTGLLVLDARYPHFPWDGPVLTVLPVPKLVRS